MPQIKKTLATGIHTIGLPIDKPTALEELFPRELQGALIQKLMFDGTWTEEEVVRLNHNNFGVSDLYQTLHPLDTIRLILKRPIEIDWDVSFTNKKVLTTQTSEFELGFDLNEALHFAQLSELVYKDEEQIKHIIDLQYDYDEVFYHSKVTHRRLAKYGFIPMLRAFLKGKMSIVDLQFMCLKKHDKNTGKDLTVFIFKGSKEPHDWLTNFKFNETDFYQRGKVHQGFYHSLKLFFHTLNTKSKHINKPSFENPFLDMESFNKNSNVILAGHSLGGAIASLVGCYLIESGINKENIEVYSFGSPPVGTEEFCSFYQDKLNLYRLVNSSDVVPKLDKITSLFHIGDELILNSNNGEVHSCNGYIDNLLDSICLDNADHNEA